MSQANGIITRYWQEKKWRRKRNVTCIGIEDLYDTEFQHSMKIAVAQIMLDQLSRF